MENEEEKFEIDIENQTKLRELEQFYTTGKVDNMLETIEKQKDKITNEIMEFAESHKKAQYNKRGDYLGQIVEIKPIVINNYFFKSIVPIHSQIPMYNAEKLSLVYDYYMHILAEVNDKIGNFPSSLTSFCKLAGITLYELRSYKNGSDKDMRVVAEKIYDEIGDNNITMGQLGVTNERSTIFKLKTQNELIEKQQPRVSINITEKPDMDAINERLDKYIRYANKRGN